LPSGVLGPVECCAFDWFAMTCAGVANLMRTPKRKNAGEA
jgi:hypothetical protein